MFPFAGYKASLFGNGPLTWVYLKLKICAHQACGSGVATGGGGKGNVPLTPGKWTWGERRLSGKSFNLGLNSFNPG